MLEKFKVQIVVNAFHILGGANTSDDIVDGAITDSEGDFIIILGT